MTEWMPSVVRMRLKHRVMYIHRSEMEKYPHHIDGVRGLIYIRPWHTGNNVLIYLVNEEGYALHFRAEYGTVRADWIPFFADVLRRDLPRRLTIDGQIVEFVRTGHNNLIAQQIKWHNSDREEVVPLTEFTENQLKLIVERLESAADKAEYQL
jgi:hypothetical protein